MSYRAMEMICLGKFHYVLNWVLLEIVLIVLSDGNTLDNQLKGLDLFVKHTVKCRNIPGLALSLVKDGKVLFSRGYGFSDIAEGVKATEHTEFCIGSLTKAFTSAVLADVLSKEKK